MPFIPLNPVSAVSALNHHGNEGVGNLLNDMATALDSAEWYLILGSLVSALCFSMTVVLTVMINVAWRSMHWSWYWLRGIFGLLFIMSLVFLVEPRPSHWLPSLESMAATTRRCSLTECKLRVRRWWRWRTKYAVKTKLNV